MSKNVLFLLMDDLRPEINCFGKEKLITPNLDKLSEKSTIFNNCYCQVPQCMASRASLFSGIRPKYGTWKGLDVIRFNNETTMPQAFFNNGYETVSIGKSYHFNHEDDEAWTRRYSHTFFDKENVCDGYCSGYQLPHNKEAIKNMYKRFKATKEEQANYVFPDIIESVDVDDSNYIDFQSASYAIDELVNFSQNKKNFFMTVGLYRPHLPWAVPKRYFDMYDVDKMDIAQNQFFPKNGVGKTNCCDLNQYGDKVLSDTYDDFGKYQDTNYPTLPEQTQREFIRAYCANVTFMDAQIGRIVNALEALNMLKDTIIVFAGDNGWHLGEHKLWTKCSQFEESTRVPLMIYANGLTKGEKTSSLAELLDIYPTLCELTEIEKPSHVDGVSLKTILQNKDNELNEAVFATYHDAYTVRTKVHRFSYYGASSEKGDTNHIPSKYKFELFDLEKDPQENENIYENYIDTEIVNKYKKMLVEKFEINID